MPSPLTPWLGHPDFEAHAAAIRDAPDDIAPRLALSDWLRDRGADEAADLAAGPHFGLRLAIARSERERGHLDWSGRYALPRFDDLRITARYPLLGRMTPYPTAIVHLPDRPPGPARPTKAEKRRKRKARKRAARARRRNGD